MERARELHYELGELFRALFVKTNPIPVKEACEIRGYHDGRMRSPLNRLGEEDLAYLRGVLEELEAPEAEA
jgi:4-hydroxy-tetrahydrodipicolinate synthase